MGKISILTEKQKKILSFVNDDNYLKDRFYFTGGTVLSEYYLKHRYSDDLDFFSERPIEPDNLQHIVTSWAKTLHATVTPRLIDERMYVCEFQFPKKEVLKIDLCYYPYKRLKPAKVSKKTIAIDSQYDIAVNKMTTVNQRANVKDFVDLYYLLPKYEYWDLSYGVETKFHIKEDRTLWSSDLLIVDTMTELPRMIKPLTIPLLQKYFRKKAVEIARSEVTK